MIPPPPISAYYQTCFCRLAACRAGLAFILSIRRHPHPQSPRAASRALIRTNLLVLPAPQNHLCTPPHSLISPASP
jgi:hypothetical protein